VLALAAFLADTIPDWIPDWLLEPGWWRPLTHFVRVFVMDHQTGGLFLVIFLEELGVPLPSLTAAPSQPPGQSLTRWHPSRW